MKKIKNIFIAFGVSIVALFASCTNLDETPYDFITDATLDFTNEQTISELSGNVYSFLRKTYWTYYGMWDWTEDSSDLHMFPSRIGVGWGTYYCAYHKHDFTPSYNEINYVIWYHAYVGIMYANQCVINPAMIESNPQAVAEIRAVRAFLYYILFDSYRNIPILQEGEVEPGYLPTQVEPQDAFDYIVGELEAIVDELPETNEFGYPTKYMAYMTLAKMHLNYYAWFQDKVPYDEGDKSHYEEALKWADKVINGPYVLSANYADNHKQDLSGNKEVIWALDLDDTQASGCYLSAVNLPDMGKAAFGYTAGAWNGGCAVPQFIDTYMHRPVDKNNDGKQDLDIMGFPEVEYLDTRFYDTWAYGLQYAYGKAPGQVARPVALKGEADSQGKVYVYYTKDVHSIDTPGAYMLEGYRYKKSEIVPEDKGTFGNDTPIYRLADAYLIAAECALRLGGSKTLATYTEDYAAELVSKVRQRAFRSTDPSLATVTAQQLKEGSVYDYGLREYTYSGADIKDEEGKIISSDNEAEHPNFSFAEAYAEDQKNGTNYCNATWEGGDDIEFGALLDELAWEFVGEFHRRQDLIRFRTDNGNGPNVWNGKSWFCKKAEADPQDYHKNVYPICVQNMESNRALVQNPQY